MYYVVSIQRGTLAGGPYADLARAIIKRTELGVGYIIVTSN